jgi:hypothetical protein
VQKDRNSAVSVAAILTGQPYDPRQKTWFIIWKMPLPSLCVPMLPKHTTCPAFAQSITAKSIFCLSTARRRFAGLRS